MSFSINPNSISGGYSGNSFKTLQGGIHATPVTANAGHFNITPSFSHSVNAFEGGRVGGGVGVSHSSGFGGSFHSHGGTQTYSAHHQISPSASVNASYSNHRGGGSSFMLGARAHF